jgi:three-Cys-motif partner protein
MSAKLKIDEIGYWSEVKLAILASYARLYNQILHSNRFRSIYIDGFAGAGYHKAKGSGRIVEGSPTRALKVKPAFDEYHFIDMDPSKAGALAGLGEGRKNVHVYEGDCNEVLIKRVFPLVRWENYQRALCILDPYGLHLNWEVIQAAADSRAIEIFLNFPVMDMNRNVFWHDFSSVDQADLGRMTALWGDKTWEDFAYDKQPGLFGEMQEKNPTDVVVSGFQDRLKKVAGFAYVPNPIPMRNSRGAVVYYLFFAAHNSTAHKIVAHIFERYARYGEVPNG